MIALKYINKNAATVAALRDYHNMRFIINNTPGEIKHLYEKMSTPGTPQLSRTPTARNPQARADQLAAQFDQLDILRERYRQAIEYMAWFEPAWSSLTDTEQHILSEYYLGDNQKSEHLPPDECAASAKAIERLRSG